MGSNSQKLLLKCGLFVHRNSSRFKREECHSTFPQHPPFSPWKVLIGPSDWEEYFKNKDGVERYRVHNLSKCSSTGLYELGISLQRSHSTKKIDNDQVIPVYLGQADNVRTRLQQYGRKGSHLEVESLNINSDDNIQQENRLFSDLFLKGFAIMYRWTPMISKQEAERKETELLGVYDYAWNKGNNGTRRFNDILKKIDETVSDDTKSLGVSSKIQNIYHNETSVKFYSSKPLLLENGSIIYNNLENNDVFSQILKIGRSNPRRITVTFDTNNDGADVCGVALGRGCICTRPPAEGRKRCDEHEGIKTNGLKSKLHEPLPDDIGDNHLLICGFTCENGYICTSQIVPGRKRCEEHKGKKKKQQTGKLRDFSQKSAEVGLICGANTEDGIFCARQAVIGRKRCEEHKGRKIKHQFIHFPEFVSAKTLESEKSKFTNIEETDQVGPICGVSLGDGSSCKTPPVEGRKRCLQHKGMRVYSEGSPSTSTFAYNHTIHTKASSDICGAGLGDGSICCMVPVRGRKRCEKHKGMRAAFC